MDEVSVCELEEKNSDVYVVSQILNQFPLQKKNKKLIFTNIMSSFLLFLMGSYFSSSMLSFQREAERKGNFM